MRNLKTQKDTSNFNILLERMTLISNAKSLTPHKLLYSLKC